MLTRDAIASVNAGCPSGRRKRSGDRDVGTLGPHGLLCLLGELANKMGVVDHEAGAPAMRCVDLADLQNDVEPRVEVEPVAAEARRINPGQAGGKFS